MACSLWVPQGTLYRKVKTLQGYWLSTQNLSHNECYSKLAISIALVWFMHLWLFLPPSCFRVWLSIVTVCLPSCFPCPYVLVLVLVFVTPSFILIVSHLCVVFSFSSLYLASWILFCSQLFPLSPDTSCVYLTPQCPSLFCPPLQFCSPWRFVDVVSVTSSLFCKFFSNKAVF